MHRLSLAGLLTCLAAFGAGALPAAAQTLPVEMFLPPARPHATATPASAQQGFNLSAAPLPTSSFQPRRPAQPSTRESVTVATQGIADKAALEKVALESAAPIEKTSPKPAQVPLPPIAPRAAQEKVAAVKTTAEEEPVVIAPKPVVTAAAGTRAIARVEQLSNAEVIARANAYFSNITTMVADFTQVGGDGRKLGGTLYLQRPGKLRFEYDPPATLEVIADGASISVRDKKLLTQDMYFIQQTPLKFLLREHVNLGQDIAVTGVATEADSVRVNLEDRSTLGGTSRIMLYFDPDVKTLNQWRIVDPQGFQTIVMLNKIERGRSIDQSLFRIPNAPTSPGSTR
ncbi:outer-membrane lipoprotein carrier protein LolA [Microvirga flavescens]|uniref:outer-membrane lipoprotein carrier protein LolA n=1 Tax=Microvirga flavescens TaxID=2249811 RepID=UPI001FE1153C|nr:outer-membrane lipoprotein carrier protein LolA [Microvirga flavescens]